MSLMPSDEVSIESHANHPSDAIDLGRQAITLFLSLGTVVLCGWVNGRF
ncbi:hypothetical protein OAI49_00360 [Synechococcus sp. AH-558-M21]|nr:hypothetical protein [Synechococcus sp. AH-558-M21]